MRNKHALVVLVIAGCAAPTVAPPEPMPLVGKFNDYNETFTGELRFIGAPGRYVVALTTKQSKMYCEGASSRTYTTEARACEGYIGLLLMDCNDGRRLTADYHYKTCESGEGTGMDNAGARLSFAYGLSDAERQQYLASAEAELAGKPPLGQGPRVVPSGGSGTGFLISADGLIVTNHHVIDGANMIEVHRGTVIYRATVVARDPANDLAVLKTEMKGQPLRLASARASMRGEDVLTLGYPLSNYAGEAQKATFGRINATVGLDDDARYLQIDVPIQPGNSGGPLLNKRGEVIGVVSASLDDRSAFARTGAVPQVVNYAVKVDYLVPLLPSSAELATNSLQQNTELTALVGMMENSIVRIVSKP